MSILLFGTTLTPNITLAHSSPVACTGSSLSINLYADKTDADIGDTVKYSLTVFNGISTR